MRLPLEVREVEGRRVPVAPALELGVCLRVRGDERGRRDADQILRRLLVVEELRAGDAHDLDAHAHEAHVVDVLRHVGAGTREPHPGGIRVGLREDAASHVLGKVIADDELGSHDAVRLGVASALDVTGVPELRHLCPERRDDVVEIRLLVRLCSLLRQPESVVLPLPVDESGHQRREPVSEEPVESGPKERIEAALDMDEEQEQSVDPVEEGVAGVCRRQAEARTGVTSRARPGRERAFAPPVGHVSVSRRRRAQDPRCRRLARG